MTETFESAYRQLLKSVIQEVAAELMEQWREAVRKDAPQSAPVENSLLLTARETAKRLAISQKTLSRITHKGQLPCIRIGCCIRYNVETVQKWVRETESSLPETEDSDSHMRASE